ncbi:DUF5994 family protein [Nocardia transvalensis]|uniref:DUF5994 family protein n=1 Tax=Nocardia transvalensis TaxID=37333 RepID=UPI0018943987|nr:DUF5994 family protein [Nocardia transvalensis]MBF6328453.1 hypothetical protein [Nocardia transvalensis]
MGAGVGFRSVRFDGYRLEPAHTLDVLGVSGDRIALLVVPPDTTPDVAHATMNATARSANPSTVTELLTITARAHRDHAESKAAQHTWDSEGGAAAG